MRVKVVSAKFWRPHAAVSERDLSAVLPRLREELREGRHQPGEALNISDVAQRLGFSPTPVREALAHLAGEGLLRERRGQGYFVASVDAEILAERYGLQQLYLAAALRAPSRAVPLPVLTTEAVPSATELVFAAIIAAAGDSALAEAHQRLSHQLAAARRVEQRLFGDPERELATLGRLFDAKDRSGLEVACEAYHQRRRGAASELVALLRAGPVSWNI